VIGRREKVGLKTGFNSGKTVRFKGCFSPIGDYGSGSGGGGGRENGKEGLGWGVWTLLFPL